MNRYSQIRIALFTGAAVLLAVGWLRTGTVKAVPEDDPNVIWSIGKEDRSSGEFTPGSADSLDYTAGRGKPSDWRQQHEAGVAGSAPVYRVRFRLDTVPPATPLLVVNTYTLGVPPWRAQVDVNGKQGQFLIRGGAAGSTDDNQGNSITYSYQTLKVPIEPGWLKADDNEVGIAFLMPDE